MTGPVGKCRTTSATMVAAYILSQSSARCTPLSHGIIFTLVNCMLCKKFSTSSNLEISFSIQLSYVEIARYESPLVFTYALNISIRLFKKSSYDLNIFFTVAIYALKYNQYVTLTCITSNRLPVVEMEWYTKENITKKMLP